MSNAFGVALPEVQRVLRPDGIFVVSCPFNVRIHNHPSDYWRFTPEAFEVLLEDYPQKIIGYHGPEERPENVWAVAFGADHPPIPDDLIEQYKKRIDEYAQATDTVETKTALSYD